MGLVILKQVFSIASAVGLWRPRAYEVFDSTDTRQILAASMLVALAMFSPVSVAQTSELTVAATSDSEGTTGMHYTVMRYANAKCQKAEKPRKLFRKKFASSKQAMGPTQIPVVDEFWFQVSYHENRRGEERSCDYLIGFKPKRSRKYEAVMALSGQVSSCQLLLFDITNERQKVEFVRPENSCKKVNQLGQPNGAPVHNSLKRF